jgi:hypothetical protein
MELEVGGLTGAGYGEKNPARLVQRRYHDVPSGAGAAWGETWNRCRWRTQVA